MENPFSTIEAYLNRIENHLIEKSGSSSIPSNSADGEFRFMPIQDIFDRKICSKPTFYEHLKKGEFSLYKFGDKSFVDKAEFISAFHEVKFNEMGVCISLPVSKENAARKKFKMKISKK
jgi:hypothetical protein